jgi:GxxExxY protein
MNTQKQINELAYEIIGACIEVHRATGPGLLENTYEECLYFELTDRKLKVARQQNVPFVYKNQLINCNLKLDLLVEDTAIIEIKAVENMIPVYDAQILTYMKLLQKPKGILANFHSDNVQRNCKHFINEYFRKLPLE